MAELKNYVSIGSDKFPCLVLANETYYKQDSGVPHVVPNWACTEVLNLLEALDLYPNEPGTTCLTIKVVTVKE